MNKDRASQSRQAGVYLIWIAVALFLGAFPASFFIAYVLPMPMSPEMQTVGFVLYLCTGLPIIPVAAGIAGALIVIAGGYEKISR